MIKATYYLQKMRNKLINLAKLDEATLKLTQTFQCTIYKSNINLEITATNSASLLN